MTLALSVQDLRVSYGKLAAVRGVNFEVGQGSIVAILGANGAGKSSTLNAMARNLVASIAGSVSLFGQSTSRLKAHAICRKGMVLVPEGRQIVAPLTVEENLVLGAYSRRARAKYSEHLSTVYDMFPVLHERRHKPGGLLSGGEQQMLAFGRAYMTDPRVILMDEPSMGLSPAMVTKIMGSIGMMRDLGLTVLLVEQNAVAALSIADHVYVMDGGHIVADGSASTIRSDQDIAETFLGLDHELPNAG